MVNIHQGSIDLLTAEQREHVALRARVAELEAALNRIASPETVDQAALCRAIASDALKR